MSSGPSPESFIFIIESVSIQPGAPLPDSDKTATSGEGDYDINILISTVGGGEESASDTLRLYGWQNQLSDSVIGFCGVLGAKGACLPTDKEKDETGFKFSQSFFHLSKAK
ncbi:MAG: hypothetical protein AB1546_09820 [bacterium]